MVWMENKAGILVLNRTFMPINITSVRRAFILLFLGNAVAVDENYQIFDRKSWFERMFPKDDWVIRTVSGAIPIPKVILLLKYDSIPRNRIRFSPRNVFFRDNHTCQYCGVQFPRNMLNLDHIVPRSRGGKTTWENVVCSCLKCNRKKGGRTPQEANMNLLKRPISPSSLPAVQFLMHQNYREEWRPFLLPE